MVDTNGTCGSIHRGIIGYYCERVSERVSDRVTECLRVHINRSGAL
jgi:hypothetical protein